jgi:hypothetical protein
MKTKQNFTEGRRGATLPLGVPTGRASVPERSSAACAGSAGPSPFSHSPLGEDPLGDLLGGRGGISPAVALSHGTFVGSCQGERVGQQVVTVRLCEERVSALPPVPCCQPNESIEIEGASP